MRRAPRASRASPARVALVERRPRFHAWGASRVARRARATRVARARDARRPRFHARAGHRARVRAAQRRLSRHMRAQAPQRRMARAARRPVVPGMPPPLLMAPAASAWRRAARSSGVLVRMRARERAPRRAPAAAARAASARGTPVPCPDFWPLLGAPQLDLREGPPEQALRRIILRTQP